MYVWDLDGNKYLDMSIMGIGNCLLGYGDKDVDKAVKKAIDIGVMATLNVSGRSGISKAFAQTSPLGRDGALCPYGRRSDTSLFELRGINWPG